MRPGRVNNQPELLGSQSRNAPLLFSLRSVGRSTAVWKLYYRTTSLVLERNNVRAARTGSRVVLGEFPRYSPVLPDLINRRRSLHRLVYVRFAIASKPTGLLGTHRIVQTSSSLTLGPGTYEPTTSHKLRASSLPRCIGGTPGGSFYFSP
jgi:hypothetical protein